MYLQRLEGVKSSHVNWPTDCIEKPEKLTRLFEVCDATLDSMAEAHHLFDKHQGGNPEPRAVAHRNFIYMCEMAIVNRHGVSKYGMEIIAHAVLKLWITKRQQELRLGHRP